MNGGVKFDQNKPDLSLVSYELVEEIAFVRMFGAKKYTEYGKCDCVVSVPASRLTQNQCVDVVTTKTSSSAILGTKSLSPGTVQSGQKETEKNSMSTIAEGHAMPQQSDTDLQGRKSTSFSTPGAPYAGRQSGSSLTIATQPETSEDVYASRATSESDGLKSRNGSKEHKPTCASHRIVRQGRDNWKKGFKVTRSCAAALRHIFLFLSGETNDSESGRSHLAHAVCCLEHAIYSMKHHPENDDRCLTPEPETKTQAAFDSQRFNDWIAP